MRHIKLLFIVLCIALFLYVYKLGTNPPGLYADEASTGYNIYSLLKTGRDEYGKLFAFGFRQLGSYTPPLYIYLSVPIMALLGASAFSTRFLSVICGLLVITLVFYLLQKMKICKSKTSLFFATLFFAITPWLVFFSRMGYEQNLAFLLFTLTIVLIIKSFENGRFLAFAIPVMAITTYADFPERFLMPIVFLGFGLFFLKELKIRKNLKFVIVGAILAAIIQIPNLYLLTTKSFYTKTEHFYSDVVMSQALKIDHYLPHELSVPLAFMREFGAQYAGYFSPRSLFFIGDPDPQRSIPELGVFYFWMIVPYLVGLYIVIKNNGKLSGKIILLLLVITPLTGAFTRQPFHVQRVLALLLPLTLAMSYGIDAINRKLGTKLSITIFTILFLISVLFLWRGYFLLLPQTRSDIWAFEWKPLAEFISNHPKEHFVIDQTNEPRPQEVAYFQLAFYLRIDPKIIQETADPKVVNDYYNDVDFSPFKKFANIEIKPIDWGETVHNNEIMVGNLAAISDREVKLHNLTQVFEIRDPNNQIILRGFQTHPVTKDY